MAEFFNKNVKYLRSIKGISQQVLADIPFFMLYLI